MISAQPTRREFMVHTGCMAGGMLLAGEARASSGPPEPFRHVKPGKAGVDPKKLDALAAYLDARVKDGTFPGAGIMGIRKGKVFLEYYCGTFRATDGVERAFAADVRVPVFSFSKAITATVVVMAHQEGLIEYDAPVVRYLPEFAPNGKDAVTVRHLLTHSAGIPNAKMGNPATEAEWVACVKELCAAELEWAPGSRTQYHGATGAFLAAEVVRRVSNMKPWPAICRERLFDPIGASSFSFAQPETPSARDAFDATFRLGHPAGGAAGTILDILRVVQLHLDGGVWKGRRLIQPAAFKEMHTVQYAAEIAKDHAAGVTPRHEPWGLGWLLRGEGPKPGAAYWFGFGDNPHPSVFGHAGIDTILGVGDPATATGYAFAVTKTLNDAEKATHVRKEVANRVFEAVRA